MYNPPGSDAGREWIEVYNDTIVSEEVSSLSLVVGGHTHKLKLVQGSASIPPGEFAIITTQEKTFIEENPSYHGVLLHASFSLKNSGDTVVLEASTSTQASFNYTSSLGADGDGNTLNQKGGAAVSRAPSPGTSIASSILAAPRALANGGSTKKRTTSKKTTASHTAIVSAPEAISEDKPSPRTSQVASVGIVPSMRSTLAFVGIIALAIMGVLAAREYAKREWSIIEED